MIGRLRGAITSSSSAHALLCRHTFLKRLLFVSVLNQRGTTAFIPSPNLHHIPTRSLSLASLHSAPTNSMGSNNNSQKDGRNYSLAQDSSELFDLYPAPPSMSQHNSIITSDWGPSYFPSPKPTGKVKERGRVHVDGDWHRSVQVWIVQKYDSQREGADEEEEKVRVLLQRRSPYKDTHPNLLDVSCAGHVNAGDDVLDTTIREMEEELGGGNGMIQGMYSLEDVARSKAFIVSSDIEGETEKYGRFTCREYQDVFILWWKGETPMETTFFAPWVEEEVSGFEIMDGSELIKRMRREEVDNELVPRSIEYVNALAIAIGCER